MIEAVPSGVGRIAAVMLLVLAAHVDAQTWRSSEGRAAAPPGEPTVSREEAAVLREAESLARTDVRRAIDVLRRAVTADSSPAILFALGTFCYQDGRLEEAERSFREALERMPEFHRARENLARVLLLRGEHAAAARELTLLVESPILEKGGLWKLLAYAWLAEGKAVAAETAYRTALLHDPDDPEVRMGLVRALVDQNRSEAARPLLEMEIAQDPIRSDLWALLADIDLTAGRNHDALVRLECARRLGIAGTEAKLALGDLLMSEGYPSEGIALYRECAGLADASGSRLLGVLEGLVALERTGEARALLGDLETAAGRQWSKEESRRLVAAKAALEEVEGDTEAALALYRSILAENPLDAPSLMAAGDLLRRHGELEQAAILFERVARVSPEHRADALVGQAQIAVDREDYATAARLLEESLGDRRRPHVERYLEEVRRMLD